MVLGHFAAVYAGFVIDIAELEALYDDLESDRVERKASASGIVVTQRQHG